MFTVEGNAYKSLQEAREAAWERYGDPITIRSVDGQPVERWRGRKELGLIWENPAGHHKTIVTENQHERNA